MYDFNASQVLVSEKTLRQAAEVLANTLKHESCYVHVEMYSCLLFRECMSTWGTHIYTHTSLSPVGIEKCGHGLCIFKQNRRTYCANVLYHIWLGNNSRCHRNKAREAIAILDSDMVETHSFSQSRCGAQMHREAYQDSLSIRIVASWKVNRLGQVETEKKKAPWW